MSNEEIKEILDRLDRIDHKEYCCGFEFADSSTFDETCRCFEERKKFADYITNLQEENKKLKERVQIGQNAFLSLNNKRDKAVKYIKEHTDKVSTIRIPKLDFSYNDLLNILGGDKE